MTTQDKKSQGDEKAKNAGRPAVGIPEDDVITYWKGIARWAEQRKLAQWLRDPEEWVEAQEAFEKIINNNKKEAAELLNQWRQDWLSPEGWKRLQANIRQNRYLKGRESKTGDKQKRERVRAAQLKESTYVDLKFYAKSLGHKVTLNDAVLKLLEIAESQKKPEDKPEPLELTPDRHVWQCPKCNFTLESETEEILRNEQAGHKFMDCPGDWEN